eukprot:TRINITY_DN19082_c0_g1_i2.p1 TRINITY_DN19082_c0_g1~~TRINITY_DN19082_c0_g1_i2.p1  ORF type:complete len:296 (-),score=82.74 TRINITY_DN19082_c0_g1_i2:414-1301(-)
MGNNAFQRKEYKTALAHYTRAIHTQSQQSLHVYYSNRAACHLALKDYKNGLDDASQCVALNPKFVKGYFRQCVAMYELGQHEQAKATLECVKALPNLKDSEAADLTRLEESIAVSEARSNQNESSAGADLLECSWDAGDMGFEMKRQGDAAFKGGLFDQAVVHYTEAIQRLDAEGLEKEVAIVQNNRAACYQQLGNHLAVVEDCTSALAVLGGNCKALIRRGLALESLEQYPQALADMTAALERDSRSAIAFKARSRLVKYVKAKQEEFVLVCPNSPSAQIGEPWSGLEIDELCI